MDEQQECTLKTEHAHLPSPSNIQAQNFSNKVREKAANTGNASRQIVFNAQIDMPLYAAPTMSSYSTSLWIINRIRQQALETIPKPKNLESIDEIAKPLKLTLSGDTFLYFDSCKSDSRILVLQHYLRSICFLSQKSVIAMERFQWHQMSSTKFILFMVRSKTQLYPWCMHCCPKRLKTLMKKLFGCLKQFGKNSSH